MLGGLRPISGDVEVVTPPASVSCIRFSPTEDILVAGSWDCEVRAWQIDKSNGQTKPVAEVKHNGPVLDVCWSSDGTRIFSASADKSVKMWTPQTKQHQQVAAHADPIKCVEWVPDHNAIVTGSWDKSVKYWDLRTANPVGTVSVQERVYCMDVLSPLMVVGLANRIVLILDLRKPSSIYREIQSPLRYQSRCVACFPDKTGFALGSIEGRVGIQYAEEKHKDACFAFKCHREDPKIYAVNAISFHQRYGTFSTAGSDGSFNFWDKNAKQRLKSFPSVGMPIVDTCFNKDGELFAYACAYDWSKGHQFYDSNQGSKIYLHRLQDSEIAPRQKKS